MSAHSSENPWNLWEKKYNFAYIELTLTTNCGAKLRYHKGQSQGKEGREVRIYTIKNCVKYLTGEDRG